MGEGRRLARGDREAEWIRRTRGWRSFRGNADSPEPRYLPHTPTLFAAVSATLLHLPLQPSFPCGTGGLEAGRVRHRRSALLSAGHPSSSSRQTSGRPVSTRLPQRPSSSGRPDWLAGGRGAAHRDVRISIYTPCVGVYTSILGGAALSSRSLAFRNAQLRGRVEGLLSAGCRDDGRVARPRRLSAPRVGLRTPRAYTRAGDNK